MPPSRLSFQQAQTSLAAFRQRHPATLRRIDGVSWYYIACGAGEETLLLLPGAPGRSDTAFQDILFFEARYRIIAPGYPAEIRSIDQLLYGLLEILRAEQVQRTHVIGGSYSGLIAQCLLRRSPERIMKLVLSHASVPRKLRGYAYAALALFIRLLPIQMLRITARMGLALYMREISGKEQALWYCYFREVVETFSKADYLSRLLVHSDIDRHMVFRRLDQPIQPIFILEAADDPLSSQSEREQLKQLYPTAQVYTFTQTGHSAWATQSSHYFQLIDTFLGS